MQASLPYRLTEHLIEFRRDRREAVFLFRARHFVDVRYWHKADIASCTAYVRYWGQSGQSDRTRVCPLLGVKRT
jgi:hypothetical protein